MLTFGKESKLKFEILPAVRANSTHAIHVSSSVIVTASGQEGFNFQGVKLSNAQVLISSLEKAIDSACRRRMHDLSTQRIVVGPGVSKPQWLINESASFFLSLIV